MRLGIRPVPDFPGYYAGNDGIIYSTWSRGTGAEPDSKPLTPIKGGLSQNKHYLNVVLKGFGKKSARMYHSVIAEAWLGPRPAGHECSHLNGNSLDNRPENLAWETRKKNLSRRVEHGTHDRGLNNSRSLDRDIVIGIKKELVGGKNQHEVADKFNVSQQTVSRIHTGQRYSEVEI